MFQYHNEYDTDDLKGFEFSRPGRRKKNWFRIFVEAVILTGMLFCLYWLLTNKADVSSVFSYQQKTSKYESITADEFYKEYLESPEAVMKKYKNRKMKVTGRLMDEDVSGEYFVLGPVSGSRPDVGIQCVVGKSTDKSRFKKLHLGAKIIVTGKFTTIESGTVVFKVTEFEARS